jgi:hypothetical protein
MHYKRVETNNMGLDMQAPELIKNKGRNHFQKRLANARVVI